MKLRGDFEFTRHDWKWVAEKLDEKAQDHEILPKPRRLE